MAKARFYGLKTRLTVMMALLLGACLSLLYLLNLQAEREILRQLEETVVKLQDDVNVQMENCVAQQLRAAPAVPALRGRDGRWIPLARPLTPVVPNLDELFKQNRLDELWVELSKYKVERSRGVTRRKALIQFIIRGGEERAARSPLRKVEASTVGGIPRESTREGDATSRGGGASAAETSDGGVPLIPVPLEPVRRLMGNFRLVNFLIVISVFVLGIVSSWVLATRFTSPLRRMGFAFGRVAAGDLRDTDLPRRRDEIGEMGESFRVMVGKLKENRDLEKRMFEQERFSTLGHLAAGVAHDVRNPLNAIGLTIDHMQDEFCPEEAEKKASFLRFTAAIRSEIARLNSLVNNFLSLAKPPSLDVKPQDLNEIVEDLLGLIRKEAESRGITLRTELDPVLPPVPLDGERIRAAVMNLVLNAIQGMDGKGEIHLRTKRVGRDVHLIVKDSGRGIAPKDLERVFLPYYTTREEGTGLGLTVSRVTVEGHGGRIELSSQLGRGTTVTVILPLQGPDSGS